MLHGKKAIQAVAPAVFQDIGVGLVLGLGAGFLWTRYAAYDKNLSKKANAKWQEKKKELRERAARAVAASPVAPVSGAPADQEIAERA